MMKQQWTVSLIGAALLGIPALAAQQGGALASLQTALDSTQAALEELIGLEPRIANHDTEAITRLMDLTESSDEDPQVVDQNIEKLRTDIQRLQTALDMGPSVTGSKAPARPTTGMLPGDLSTLNTPSATPGRTDQRKLFEDEGYSADQLHQAKLMVRAGQFHDATGLLRSLTTTPETRYWLARSLQGTGQSLDAKVLLQALAAEGESTHRYARWATQDLRMIELREKLSQQATSNAQASEKPTPVLPNQSKTQIAPAPAQSAPK